jgi:prepilin-type N-terminal cleavage/methylation domain-containing protein
MRGETPLKGILFLIFFIREVGDLKLSEKFKGFTLIELLVVLLIIGILVAIAIPNDMAFIKKVRDLWGW